MARFASLRGERSPLVGFLFNRPAPAGQIDERRDRSGFFVYAGAVLDECVPDRGRHLILGQIAIPAAGRLTAQRAERPFARLQEIDIDPLGRQDLSGRNEPDLIGGFEPADIDPPRCVLVLRGELGQESPRRTPLCIHHRHHLRHQ